MDSVASDEIRFSKIVKRSVKAALLSCGKDFHKHAEKTKKPRQGLEEIFELAVKRALSCVNPKLLTVDGKRGSVREFLSEKKSHFTDRGKIDVILRYKKYKIGIEFKVTSLPRLTHHGKRSSLYDLGQIMRDYVRLKQSRLDAGYCIIVFDGLGPSAFRATPEQIWHLFHNALFFDYLVSMQRGGQLRSEMSSGDKERRDQLREIRRLGFEKSFSRSKGHRHSFSVFVPEIRLAAIGLWVAK